MPVTDGIKRKLAELPHRPGVYLMRDRFGTVIYVGKARDLRKRVSSYFQPSRRMGWDLKLNALVEAVHDFDIHVVKSEPEALLLEGRLIKEFQPRYNISFRDDKQFLLLKVNLNDPIPRFTLTRLRTDDGARYFGPFPNSSALRNTMTLVRRQFNLRGCRPLTPGPADYKHCLYGHLKFCTAPCIGNVTPEQYRAQVTAACEFLAGQCDELAKEIEAQMTKAALAQEYEKAAQLRDLLADLKHTTKKTHRFPRLPYSLPQALDPEKDLAELAALLGLPAPPRRIEGFDISNISGTLAVASLVSFKDGHPDRANYRRYQIKTVTGQDDFACIAEAVRRRYTRLLREARGAGEPELPMGSAPPEPTGPSARPLTPRGGEGGGAPISNRLDVPSPAKPGPPGTTTPPVPPPVGSPAFRLPGEVEGLRGALEQAKARTTNSVVPGLKGPTSVRKTMEAPQVSSNLPDLILIDGGKGQLNAACAELRALGLAGIPVIGLAKEFEEIYRPGESEPLRIPHETGALKLLQRVRDESHRVANTYNAQLRLRKISESILDEFPGIGEQRKAALLKKFGSVQRLRRATVEEIAKVPGFGGKAAEELRAFLEARK